ncbi:uncharacterized protein LOC105219969 isoform X10 [Zeugodacus cucurbitae]|uniref:uncharacterized protein LOC105219969 isoform X10 n=1 Tax=Zeugodacus cucurbitae TaxID=28588 RepID=UPI0023D92395|nr:uncharacterized protein LOC105219969 isoform X10 [Zeugodacus cucurbitae]
MYSYFEIQMEIIHIMLVALLLLSNKVNGLEDIFMETPITSISMSPEEAPIITAALLECSKNIKDGNRQKLENYSQIRRQLLVNIRVNPSFNVEKVDKFLILDEVFDAKKSSKAKIMSPYLIEISRGEPVIMYPLEFARSLKLDELNNTKLIDNSYHGQNVTNQMEEVPKLKSGPRNSSSYLEREGTQRKKNYGSETLYGNNQSLNNSRQDYFASDVSEIEDNFDPANANGINRLPISSASVENQFVEQEKKESSSDNKQFPESFKAEAIFPKVSRLHDNNYNGPNGQKIKGIVETKRQVDLWKSNTNKSESSNIVYAEPKKYSGGIYDGSDRTVDSIENLVHYQHSMLKSPISLGSRKGHRRVYKPRFSKHRQHPKIFNSGGNEYDISSEEGNRYFKKGYCPNIYDWLNKRTADYAFQNLLNESFNSKFKNERKKIFEKGDKTFQKDSTGVHIFPTIPDKRRNHDNYAELFECRVRTPKKNTRNSNINSKEPNIHEKIMKNDEGLISPNGFHALSSLSGIFANANLSILFSSHVDIIQLEKSLLIQKHQLLIPKDDVNVYQGNIFDKTFKNEKNWLNLKNNENIRGPHQVSPENNLLAYHALDDKYFILPQYPRSLDVKEHFKRKSLHTFIKTLADLGYFPRTMNMLDRCPSNSTRLCLNMLSDKVPVIIFQSVFVGRQLHKIKQFLLLRWIRILFTQDTRYSIKLKMPFQENDIIFQNAFKVKIARIITDTTTKDILQISVDVISESLVGQIFSILISNCGIPCSAARSTVMRPLLPYIGDTITFLLPLMQDVSNKRQKFKCDVLVKVSVEKNLTHYPVKIPPKIKSEVMVLNNSTTISSRTIFVETENRCFCIWHCNCHCITKLETHVNFNICKKMDYEDMQKAGLLSSFSLNKYFEDNFYEYGATRKQEILYFLIRNASILLLIMLILGLLKALIGRFCSTSIDRCGFGYAQSGKRYEDSSDSRRFFLNVVLFIVFPFFFLCKCFAPSDLDLLAASTEWQCEIFEPSPILSEDKSHCSGHGQLNTKKIDKDEDILLSQHMDCCSKKTLDSAKCNNVLTRLRAGDNLCDKKHHLNHIRSIIYNGFLDINKNDDTDEEHNTKYILKTLAESRESLKNLLQSSTIDTLNVVTATNEKFQQASIFVQTLCDAQIVYRTFDRPVGNVQNIPYGITYCIQGYFLPSSETMYEFVSYHPLVQYYGFTFDGVSMEALRPPVLLYAKEFNHLYRDKLEVLNAKDLHIQLPYYVPCINVSSPDFISPFLFKISST